MSKFKFPLAMAGIYVGWALLSSRVLALTPIGSVGIIAIGGLLLGLMPLVQQLTAGRRPQRPNAVALASCAIALAATLISAFTLDSTVEGMGIVQICGITAGYLLGLCWHPGKRRTVALSAIAALALGGLAAGLFMGWQSALPSGLEGARLISRLPTLVTSALALLLGVVLPVERIARRRAIPLAIAAVQLIVTGAAMLRYMGAVQSEFATICGRLTMGLYTNYALHLNLGIAGILLRQGLFPRAGSRPVRAEFAPARNTVETA